MSFYSDSPDGKHSAYKLRTDGNFSAFKKCTITFWLKSLRNVSSEYPSYTWKDYDWVMNYDYETTNGLNFQTGGVTYSTNTIQSGWVPNIGQWYHIAATIDLDPPSYTDSRDVAALWVDGVKRTVTASTSNGNPANTSAVFNNTGVSMGGCDPYANSGHCMMDDATIFGLLLDEQEIVRLAMGEHPEFVKPEGIWRALPCDGFTGIAIGRQNYTVAGTDDWSATGYWENASDTNQAPGHPSPVEPTWCSTRDRALLAGAAAIAGSRVGGARIGGRIGGGLIV